MKTLEQHNAECEAIHEKALDNEPRQNGIACPRCGTELWDSHPMMMTTLTGKPPKKAVHCTCGYRGYRFV